MPARKQTFTPTEAEIEILRTLSDPSPLMRRRCLPKSRERERLVRNGAIETEKLPRLSGYQTGGTPKAYVLTRYGRELLTQYGKAAA